MSRCVRKFVWPLKDARNLDATELHQIGEDYMQTVIFDIPVSSYQHNLIFFFLGGAKDDAQFLSYTGLGYSKPL